MLAVRRPCRSVHLRAGWRQLLALGLFNVLALYCEGTRVGPLSIVSMSASMHSVATAVFAAWLLREHHSTVQRTAVALATAEPANMLRQ